MRCQLFLCFFCFGQFIFQVIFNCIVSVCVPYCYKGASPVATERIHTVSVFKCKRSSGYGSCMEKSLGNTAYNVG